MRVSEIRVNQIRVNQGLGVHQENPEILNIVTIFILNPHYYVTQKTWKLKWIIYNLNHNLIFHYSYKIRSVFRLLGIYHNFSEEENNTIASAGHYHQNRQMERWTLIGFLGCNLSMKISVNLIHFTLITMIIPVKYLTTYLDVIDIA